MSASAAIAILKASAAVNTAVSGNIYNQAAPDTIAQPYIILYSDGSEPVNSLDGACTTQYNSIILQVVGSSLTLIKSIGALCKTALELYQGTINGTEVVWIAYDGENPEEYDPTTKTAIIEHNYRATVRV
jgi:hypothetical protein